jgi:hypothetical protein
MFVHILYLLTIYFLYFWIYGLFIDASVCSYMATRGNVFGGKQIGNDFTRIDHDVIYVQNAYFHWSCLEC